MAIAFEYDIRVAFTVIFLTKAVRLTKAKSRKSTSVNFADLISTTQEDIGSGAYGRPPVL